MPWAKPSLPRCPATLGSGRTGHWSAEAKSVRAWNTPEILLRTAPDIQIPHYGYLNITPKYLRYVIHQVELVQNILLPTAMA